MMSFGEIAAAVGKEVLQEVGKGAEKAVKDLAVEAVGSVQKNVGWAGGSNVNFFASEIGIALAGDGLDIAEHLNLEDIWEQSELPTEIGEDIRKADIPPELEISFEPEIPSELDLPSEMLPDEIDAGEGENKRELTEEEKQKLREENNLPESLLDAVRVDENGNYKVKCINERYKDMENPDTGIRYVEKTITVNVVEITVVVPEFPTIFDVEIPPEIWEKGDTSIFKYCTEKLCAYLNEHPEMKSNFTPEQLKAIERDMPRVPGMTWHHSETPGKMQLVDFKTHFDTRHTGGDFLWCGGIR